MIGERKFSSDHASRARCAAQIQRTRCKFIMSEAPSYLIWCGRRFRSGGRLALLRVRALSMCAASAPMREETARAHLYRILENGYPQRTGMAQSVTPVRPFGNRKESKRGGVTLLAQTGRAAHVSKRRSRMAPLREVAPFDSSRSRLCFSRI